MLSRAAEVNRAVFCLASQCRRLATTTTIPNIEHLQGIHAGILLARSPTLTRTPTPFEQAYYDYQGRLRRALSNPFPHEFYFKPGSPLEKKFKLEEKKRENWLFHRPMGAYYLKKFDEEMKQAADVVEEQFVSERRRTTADFFNNQRSLNRFGERTLYLVVQKRGNRSYTLPQGDVLKGELLHEATRRTIDLVLGKNLDTWVVGRLPVGFHERISRKGVVSKTFFLKAHIFAGQVEIDRKEYNDFLWLSKEEMEQKVPSEYWKSIRDMISEV